MMGGKRRFTDEQLRERRNRQWWESRARCGYATVCPECGGYTLSPSGYHRVCAKAAGLAPTRRAS